MTDKLICGNCKHFDDLNKYLHQCGVCYFHPEKYDAHISQPACDNYIEKVKN